MQFLHKLLRKWFSSYINNLFLIVLEKEWNIKLYMVWFIWTLNNLESVKRTLLCFNKGIWQQIMGKLNIKFTLPFYIMCSTILRFTNDIASWSIYCLSVIYKASDMTYDIYQVYSRVWWYRNGSNAVSNSLHQGNLQEVFLITHENLIQMSFFAHNMVSDYRWGCTSIWTLL